MSLSRNAALLVGLRCGCLLACHWTKMSTVAANQTGKALGLWPITSVLVAFLEPATVWQRAADGRGTWPAVRRPQAEAFTRRRCRYGAASPPVTIYRVDPWAELWPICWMGRCVVHESYGGKVVRRQLPNCVGHCEADAATLASPAQPGASHGLPSWQQSQLERSGRKSARVREVTAPRLANDGLYTRYVLCRLDWTIDDAMSILSTFLREARHERNEGTRR